MGQLKLMEGFLRETKKKGVTIVNMKSVKAVDEDRSCVLSEVKGDTANVAHMETCRPSDVFDVRFK